MPFRIPRDPEKEFTIPFAILRDPCVKHSQSLYDAEKGDPTRIRPPHDTAHPPLQMDKIPFRIPHDPEKVFTIPFTIPRDPEEKHSQPPSGSGTTASCRGTMPARSRTPIAANGCDPPQDPARSRAGVPAIPSRSHVIPRRSTHNPSRSRTTVSYKGMIPARFPTLTSANGYDPHTIPRRGANDPCTIPCDPEEKHSRSPHDPAQRHPTRP